MRSEESEKTEFRSQGWFDPLEARRLIDRLERRGLRCHAEGRGEVICGRGATQLRRVDEVEISVHRDDEEKAQAILNDDDNA
jgi:hypothetical protein